MTNIALAAVLYLVFITNFKLKVVITKSKPSQTPTLGIIGNGTPPEKFSSPYAPAAT